MSLVTRVDFEEAYSEFIAIVKNVFLNPDSIIKGVDAMKLVYSMCMPEPKHEELFVRVAEFINLHTQNVLFSHELLMDYAQKWSDFYKCAQTLDKICSSLNNKICFPSHLYSAAQDVDVTVMKYKRQQVINLCINLWKDNVFMKHRKTLVQAALNAIKMSRMGNNEQLEHVKILGMSLVELNQETDKAMALYCTEFESVVISDTRLFYRMEASQNAKQLSVTCFMEQTLKRIKEETKRAVECMHESSHEKMFFEASNELIQMHSKLILDAFDGFLNSKDKVNCLLAFNLLALVPKGLKNLSLVYESFVLECGKKLKLEIPADLVHNLGEFHQQRASEIVSWFQQDPSFVAAMDKAFRILVNDVFCDSAEYLAQYCDFLLKKQNKQPEPMILKTLQTVFTIFTYIDDKDMFQQYYSVCFAKRLIYKTSISDDLEQQVLNKLRDTCGVEYTSKLTRMFNDVKISLDLNAQFQSDLDFQVIVMNSGSWPVQLNSTTPVLSKELNDCSQKFREFYYSLHTGRKLNYVWQMCRVDLKANLDKRYEISATLHQALCLLMFNEKNTLEINEIQSQLNLSDSDLNQLCQTLLESNLLKKTNNSMELNLEFENKRQKIKLIVPSFLTKEKAPDQKILEEDRRMFLQALIVRILKSFREMSHNDLITEVFKNSNRFNPKIQMIKRSIEQLLEKQYIKFENEKYHYLA